MVVDLIRRGYLHSPGLAGSHKVRQPVIETAPGLVGEGGLTSLERDFFKLFTSSRKPSELFRHSTIAERIRFLFGPIEESLVEDELLAVREHTPATRAVFASGMVMILALGGIKLGIALAKGRHNIAFLLIFGAIGLLALALASRIPRLTARGRAYLDRLRLAFSGQKRTMVEAPVAGADPTWLLVPALFGVGALSDTPYEYTRSLFRPSASSMNGSSCGSGCGSSGCSGGGGGCGGGGGGCGGGGCGGCGGS